MHQLKLDEAESKLAELVDEVASGEDVVITRGDGLAFRIVITEESSPPPFQNGGNRAAIAALRGVGRGEGLRERLLEERARDRRRGS